MSEKRKPMSSHELEANDKQRVISLDELTRWIDLFILGKEQENETASETE